MNHILTVFFFIIFFSVSGVQAQSLSGASSGSGSSDVPINEWILFKKVNGVEFYLRHQESPYDMKLNTMIRLRNTNSYEVVVSFRPSFGCDTGQGSMKEKGEIRVSIYPRHSVTLLAYRPCRGDMPGNIEFNAMRIRMK